MIIVVHAALIRRWVQLKSSPALANYPVQIRRLPRRRAPLSRLLAANPPAVLVPIEEVKLRGQSAASAQPRTPRPALSSDPSVRQRRPRPAPPVRRRVGRRAREEAPGGATEQNSQLGLGPARNKTDNAWLAVLVSARARRRVLDVQRAASRDADGRRRRGSVRLRSVAFLSRRRFLRSPFPFVVAN